MKIDKERIQQDAEAASEKVRELAGRGNDLSDELSENEDESDAEQD